MTRLFNDPNDFVSDMSRGFALASSRWVRAVNGGVVRSTAANEPTVSLVIGGGSGHFPAFSGLVGPGLAHGTAMGNVFASPSTKQIMSVARACDQGRGVLFSYGNYAGDVLNFDQAQEQLRAEGIDAHTVVVTDDIFSAPSGEIEKRRGIAGDLVVFKVAGAAAEAGLDIAEVERLASLANDRTRSIGVAFSGCTLPGADEPLFTVPDGQMAIGLGIHGEPGIDEVPLPSAIQLAELLVARLLAEAPDRSKRVVPILNGLGTVKYEELYLLYGLIDPLLRDAGYELVDPEVGEFCTSFDMAGLSLTLLWLDDELELLWAAPCSSAAFTRGELGTPHLPTCLAGQDFPQEQVNTAALAPASAASQQLGREASAAITRIAAVLDDAAGELGRLDSVAGDGDHGIGMQRGSKAAARAAADATAAGHGAEAVLSAAGEAWADVGGGTSGAIWGRIIGTLAAGFAGDSRPTPSSMTAAIDAAVDEVRSFGGVEVGEKTLLDALVPFATEFSRAVSSPGDDSTPLVLARATTCAAHAATQAAQSTADLVAMRGRARSHGDRSVGTPDPGAISLAMIASAIAEQFASDTSIPVPTERKAARS
ncbi:dihydroxyacetone kinase family protein [Brevibacterium antiquum]|uniref:dihydroxyacetone kinase family protein n=1 Tax=Brevibacterium antiquum TaxID=234835 RepID=UPI0018DF1E42